MYLKILKMINKMISFNTVNSNGVPEKYVK